MNDPVRSTLKRRYDHLEAKPAIETVRSFLHGWLADASLEEMKVSVQRQLALKDVLAPGAPFRRAVEGIEVLVAMDAPEGTLAKIVALDANKVLEDPSDQGARMWLIEVADFLRKELERSGAPTRWPGT